MEILKYHEHMNVVREQMKMLKMSFKKYEKCDTENLRQLVLSKNTYENAKKIYYDTMDHHQQLKESSDNKVKQVLGNAKDEEKDSGNEDDYMDTNEPMEVTAEENYMEMELYLSSSSDSETDDDMEESAGAAEEDAVAQEQLMEE